MRFLLQNRSLYNSTCSRQRSLTILIEKVSEASGQYHTIAWVTKPYHVGDETIMINLNRFHHLEKYHPFPSLSRFHFLLVFQSATHSLCKLRVSEESDCGGWDQHTEICHESVSFVSCHTTHRWLHVLGCEGGVSLGLPQLPFLYACVLSMNQCWSKSKRHYLRKTTDNINRSWQASEKKVSVSCLYIMPVIFEYLQYVFDMIHHNVLDVKKMSPVPVLGKCKHWKIK